MSKIHPLSLSDTHKIHEAYPVKGDLVLLASCPGESLLPSLWHSFALSLSGKEKRETEGEGGEIKQRNMNKWHVKTEQHWYSVNETEGGG